MLRLALAAHPIDCAHAFGLHTQISAVFHSDAPAKKKAASGEKKKSAPKKAKTSGTKGKKAAAEAKGAEAKAE